MKTKCITPIPFQHVSIDSSFWSPVISRIREVTVEVCLAKCEETGRIGNFRRAAGIEPGTFQGIFFDDSDVYKVLEGVAYVLMDQRNADLEKRADTIIETICAAQLPDGYLNTYFILTGIDKRWTNTFLHEAYCLGHMIEGAIAYHRATGKNTWLNAAIRFVEHMMSIFGPGKEHWVTGHQELELALVKLFHHTGEQRFLDYAEWLINERGHGHMRFDHIGEHRIMDFLKWFINEHGYDYMLTYYQDDIPVRQLKKVTGHAVRAMYYYSAIADLVAMSGDMELYGVLLRLWDNVNPANLYITGGIGQDSQNEGFTKDWHLPNLTAYCETCASIGMALWNDRMAMVTGESRFADLVEREMYNGVLAGLSLSGDHFFYDNPLSSIGKHNRTEWFDCSCCPTNIVRFIPSLGGYVYGISDNHVYLHQFVAGSTDFEFNGHAFSTAIRTDYPWNGLIYIDITKANGVEKLLIRKPGWCESYSLQVNGTVISPEPIDGYLPVEIRSGDTIVYDMDMPVRFTRSDTRVKENLGRVAVERGPIVYCAEEIDNPGIVREYFHAFKSLDVMDQVVEEFDSTLLGGVYKIRVGETLLVPYYSWNNRGPGAMAVWLLEKGIAK
jgi:DUF1680 family protein